MGWLLGVNFTIQVIPGPGDEVLDVLAGEVDAVRRRGLRAVFGRLARHGAAPRGVWSSPRSKAAQGQQTWDNLGQALAAAARLVEEGGAIARLLRIGGATADRPCNA